MFLDGPIARGTIRTSAVLCLRLLVQAATLLLVARMLGPQHYGAFAGVVSLAVTLGALSTFGFHLVLLGRVSRDPDQRDEVMARALPATLLCGMVLLALFLLICAITLHSLAVGLPALLAIGFTELLLQPLFTLPAWTQMALGQAARSQLLNTFPLALRPLAALCVLALSPADRLTTYAFACLLASGFALLVVARLLPQAWLHPRRWQLPDMPYWREASSYAMLGITTLAPSELDKTLAAKLLPATESGLYAAAQRVVGAVTLPVSAMLLAALPRLFREGGQDAPHGGSRLRAWVLGIAALYGLLLAGAMWLAAPVFGWMFGSAYAGLADVIRWLCPALPGMTLRIAVANSLMAMGQPWMRIGLELSGLTAMLVFSLALTPMLGSRGMPVALVGSEWLMCAMGVIFMAIRPRPLND